MSGGGSASAPEQHKVGFILEDAGVLHAGAGAVWGQIAKTVGVALHGGPGVIVEEPAEHCTAQAAQIVPRRRRPHDPHAIAPGATAMLGHEGPAVLRLMDHSGDGPAAKDEGHHDRVVGGARQELRSSVQRVDQPDRFAALQELQQAGITGYGLLAYHRYAGCKSLQPADEKKLRFAVDPADQLPGRLLLLLNRAAKQRQVNLSRDMPNEHADCSHVGTPHRKRG